MSNYSDVEIERILVDSDGYSDWERRAHDSDIEMSNAGNEDGLDAPDYEPDGEMSNAGDDDNPQHGFPGQPFNPDVEAIEQEDTWDWDQAGFVGEPVEPGVRASEEEEVPQPASDQPGFLGELVEPGVRASEGEVPQPASDQPEVKSQTVAEFVTHAKQLLDAGDEDNFAKFVLTGVYDNIQHQVDPIKDAVQNDHLIEVMRDYDSVLGIHEEFCVEGDITLYPAPRFEDTLRRNIHIKRSFTNQFGEHTDIPVHHIPNFGIAKWGTHNLIRVLVPGLYDGHHRNSFLNQQQLATFYEKGLRPAIAALPGHLDAEWPPTYASELFRARGKNGQLSFQTKTLSNWLVGSLGGEIRSSLEDNNITWGEGLLFLYQIRGVKASNGHSLSETAAHNALEDFTWQNNLSAGAFQTGDWWIDVGLEIASAHHQCLAWRTDSHFHVVKNVLQITTRKAHRITSPGSSKYIRDMTSHLTAVSGCQISPGVQAEGPYEAVYLQMYSTDKSITYRPEGSHFGKFLRGEDIVKGKADDYCHDLYELYRLATDKNYALAHIEVRVPLTHASTVLVNIDVNRFRAGLVVFDPSVWWSLRAYRVLAFKLILAQQARGSSLLRGNTSALLLTAAAPWFLNGLHSTPDNGPSCRDLMGKILPLVYRTNADTETLAYPASTRAQVPEALNAENKQEEDDRDEADPQEDNISVYSMASDDNAPVPIDQPTRRKFRAETLPHNPYGIVFLRPIRIGNGVIVPRFRDSAVTMVTPKTFRYIFRFDRDDIDAAFFKSQLVIPSNPLRVSNKTRLTAKRIVEENEPPKLFNLSARGYQLPPRLRDEGSDVEFLEVSDDEDEAVDIDQKLSNLWRQSLVDITAKVANRQGSSDSSYCKLSKYERDHVNDATYQDLHLRVYFSDCQFKNATKKVWAAAFDKLWPRKDAKLTGNPQNYPSMKYYLEWTSMIELDPDLDRINAMRTSLRQRFDTLKWIPSVQSDRVWYTKVNPSFKRFAESDKNEAAPWVLIRWNARAIV